MRIHGAIPAALFAVACASGPTAGPLSEGMGGTNRIVGIDTTRPPGAVTVHLDAPASVALLLVIPGHSATLLYPRDSTTDVRKPAGQSTIAFRIPDLLVRRDSGAVRQREGGLRAQDSALRRRRPTGARGANAPVPVPVNAATYFLLLTSPQPIAYERIIERTAGVSIPSVDMEALNAVAKAVKTTLPEPRALSGFYQIVEINRRP